MWPIQKYTTIMKRKVLRSFKNIVYLAIIGLVTLFIKSLLTPHEKQTYMRNVIYRNSEGNVPKVLHATEAYSAAKPNLFHLLKNNENNEHKEEYVHKINQASHRPSTEQYHGTKTPRAAETTRKPMHTTTDENNTTSRFERILRETALRLTQHRTVVTVKSPGAGSSDPIYVIRRIGKSIKITKTIPLYPSHQINTYNSTYIITNENACKGNRKVFVLTMVFTQHKEERYRRIVREYWGKVTVVKDKRIQRIFLLGKTNNTILQLKTEQESNKFGDIVQGDFLDTYGNLTLKTLMGLQWIRDFCSEATFVLKVDSDIIVNYNALIPHLLTSPTNRFVEGRVQASAYPLRSKYSKWYIAEEDYPETTYPPYCLGPSYLMSTDVSTQVLHTAQFVRFLPWEDAYVGLVLQKLKIPSIHSNNRYIVRLKGEDIWNKICKIQQIFTFYIGHELDEDRVRFIVDKWHKKVNCNYGYYLSGLIQQQHTSKMKRKVLRYSKYIVLLVTLVLFVISLLKTQDERINQRKFIHRKNEIDIAKTLHSSEAFLSYEHPESQIQLHQNEFVEDVDEILKHWLPHFEITKKIEEHQNKSVENATKAIVVTYSTEQRTKKKKTALAIASNKNLQLKYPTTNKNVDDKSSRFEQILKETAERLTQDSIVKIRSRDAGVADSIYVIRRAGKSVKITKTKPLYPSDQVNDFNMSYIIPNENACMGDPEVFVLTIVFNQHTEERYRRIVRKYWGKARIVKGKRIQHIFLLGKTDNKLLQRRTEQESKKFGDIVQGNFMDTYKNLTLKTLLGFQWIRDFCPEATFVLKVDSDIIVNYNALIPHLITSPINGFVEGHVQSSLFPSRKKYSKWYIAEEDYPEPTYAPYVVGPSYLMSSDVSTQILHTAQFVRFLPWEDAYVGLVLKKLNITNVHSKGYIVKLKGENIWNKICEIQKYFTFYVGRELEEKRVRFIVDGWHQKVNFCND
ncbi:uncharacterized protein LOC117103172 [Anneissia japonica]|uniref:uncharacterized protein LOC117103172 n=1 Tax=Anneissia japonica TaxID=1529436 RepID=UPI001425A23C|nr:uncharacterized protein LOC117103172 [Anneissia japonica]